MPERAGPFAATLTEAACVDIVRREAFAPPPGSGAWRMGVEVEMLLTEPGSGRPVPPRPDPEGPRAGSAPTVQRWADARGWVRRRGTHGLPMWVGPRGAVVSYEPGGQLEYASPPFASVTRLVSTMESDLRALADALQADGVAVTARGLDPLTPLDAARLHLVGDRYLRQAAHYDRRGEWGRRMMRQSAALHLNVDPVGPGHRAWHLLNALVPVLMATFANSPRVAGAESGWRSARSAQWRRLDPTRTGVFSGDADPAGAYARRALAAEAFLLAAPSAPAPPFADLIRAGTVGPAEWRAHLTTFFPEVRARRYLELRSVDALPLRWAAVPLLVVFGLLRDAEAGADAAEVLLPATEQALVGAGREGVGDPERRERAVAVLELARDGLRRLGTRQVPAALVDRVDAFADRFTRAGRDPGHDPDDGFV